MSSKSFKVKVSGWENLTNGIIRLLLEKCSSAASFKPYNWNADNWTSYNGLWIISA